MNILPSALKGNWLGVHFAVNIFIATTLLWLLLRVAASLNPIWAISSMIAASDPNVHEAARTFRGRIINAGLGCVTGLFFLIIGRGHEWALQLGFVHGLASARPRPPVVVARRQTGSENFRAG